MLMDIGLAFACCACSPTWLEMSLPLPRPSFHAFSPPGTPSSSESNSSPREGVGVDGPRGGTPPGTPPSSTEGDRAGVQVSSMNTMGFTTMDDITVGKVFGYGKEKRALEAASHLHRGRSGQGDEDSAPSRKRVRFIDDQSRTLPSGPGTPPGTPPSESEGLQEDDTGDLFRDEDGDGYGMGEYDDADVPLPELPSTLTASKRRSNLCGVQARRRFPPSALTGFFTGIMSEEEKRKLATVAITNDEKLCDANNRNMPIQGGINSLEMGTTSNEHRCATCSKTARNCQGHPGMYVFPWAVFPTDQFLNDLPAELSICCWRCAEPVISKQDPHIKAIDEEFPARAPGEGGSRDRFHAIFQRCLNVKECANCSVPQPAYKKRKHMVVWTWRQTRKSSGKAPEVYLRSPKTSDQIRFEASRPFTAARARDILMAMSDANWAWAGVDARNAHPGEKILTVLFIPPPCVRPTLSGTAGSSIQNREDMTVMLYAHVVRRGNEYRKLMEKERPDDFRLYEDALPFDHVPDKVWHRRSKKVREDPAELLESERKAARAKRDTGKGAETKAGVAAGRKRSTATTLARYGGGLFASASEVLAEIGSARPTEAGRVRSLVEGTRPDAMARDARMKGCGGVAAAEWMLLVHTKEYEMYQEIVTAYFVSSEKKSFRFAKQRNGGAPKKGLFARLSKKKGFLRSHMRATRCDQSGRAVITPAPFAYDIDELGVPEVMCNVFTLPVRVNALNLSDLQKRVDRGPHVNDGAEVVIRAGSRGDVVHLHHLDEGQRCIIESGDVVHRHLQDGDPAIIGRQPTLHGPSMLVFRVRRTTHLVLQIPLVSCTGFNADFDGDEMNIHIPQTIEAVSEAFNLLGIANNFVLPQTNAPIVSFIQDVLLAAHMISRRDTFLRREEAQQMLAQCRYQFRFTDRGTMLPPPAIMKPRPMWTGKQVLSCLFPPYLNMDTRIEKMEGSDPMDDADRRVIIRGGDHICGVLTKDTFGGSNGGILNRIIRDGGNEDARCYTSDMQRALTSWFSEFGFSYHASDVSVTPVAHKKLVDTLEDVRYGLTKAQREANTLSKHLGPYESARVEQNMLQLIATGMDSATGTMEAYNQREAEKDPGNINGLELMIRAGSKGKKTNSWALKAALGQTIVQGGRIEPTSGGTTLPAFARNDPNPCSRGLVTGCYRDGIEPTEFFYHAMGGREGIAQTAVGTAKVGYMHRKCNFGMEDLVASSGGMITRSGGQVVSSRYGGDGFDPKKVEPATIYAITASRDRLLTRCVGLGEEYTGGDHPLVHKLLALHREVRRRHVFPLYGSVRTCILLPIQPCRAIEFAKLSKFTRVDSVRFFFQEMWARDSTPSNAMAADEAVCSCSGPCSRETFRDLSVRFLEYFSDTYADDGVTMALAAVWDLAEYVGRESQHVFMFAFAIVASRYEWARVSIGESVGIVTAQSVGEPSTQMTLNVFHHAGQGNAGVTLGVPRMREVLEARKSDSMSTPKMVVHVRDKGPPGGGSGDGEGREGEGEGDRGEAAARSIAKRLQLVSLQDVTCKGCFVTYDPAHDDSETGDPITVYKKDLTMLQFCARVAGTEASLDPEGKHLSPWVIRIALDPMRLQEFHLQRPVYQIVRAIQDCVQVPVVVVHSSECDARWTIRIRIWDENGEPNSPLKSRDAADELYNDVLKNAKANGAYSITNAAASQVDHIVEDGGPAGEIQTRKRWVVETQGSSLSTVACMDGVDWSRSLTNDILEVESELGIAAARRLIAHQLREVLTDGGKHVDMRHMWMVAASMTHTGRVLSLTRHGLTKMGASVLHRASFEQTQKEFLEGAASAELDYLETPTSASIMGQMPPLGTMVSGVLRERESLPPRGPRVTASALINEKNGHKPNVLADAKTGHQVTRKMLSTGKHSGRVRSMPVSRFTLTGGKEGVYVGSAKEMFERARPQQVDVEEEKVRRGVTMEEDQGEGDDQVEEGGPAGTTSRNRNRKRPHPKRTGRRAKRVRDGGSLSSTNAPRIARNEDRYRVSIKNPFGSSSTIVRTSASASASTKPSSDGGPVPQGLEGPSGASGDADKNSIAKAKYASGKWDHDAAPINVGAIRVSFVNRFGKNITEAAPSAIQPYKDSATSGLTR